MELYGYVTLPLGHVILTLFFSCPFLLNFHLCLQNKILHSQLEALHIQLAERDRGSFGTSASTGSDTSGDAGLQNVISYLRRTKEIVSSFSLLLLLSLSHTWQAWTPYSPIWHIFTIIWFHYCFRLNRQRQRFLCWNKKNFGYNHKWVCRN